MKKYFLLYLIFLQSLLIASSNKPLIKIYGPVIGYKFDPYYDWTDTNLKKPLGPEPKLIETILERNGYRYEYIHELSKINKDPRIDAITEGNADVSIRCCSITPERSKVVNFSIPYFIDGVNGIVSKESNIKSAKDLEGKVIFTPDFTTAFTWLKKNVKNYKLYIPQEEKYYNDPSLLLTEGKIDCYLLDKSHGQNLIKQNNKIRLINDKLFTKDPWGIAVHKDKISLLEKINKTLKKMKDSGELQRIMSLD